MSVTDGNGFLLCFTMVPTEEHKWEVIIMLALYRIKATDSTIWTYLTTVRNGSLDLRDDDRAMADAIYKDVRVSAAVSV